MTSRIRAGLRIPYDLNTALILAAQKRGISKNALVLQILWDWAKQNPPEQGQDAS